MVAVACDHRARKSAFHIYSFVKQPESSIGEQAQVILNTLKRTGPIPRAQLVRELAAVLETKATISAILSNNARFLLELGAIRKEDPLEYAVRLELEKRKYVDANDQAEGDPDESFDR